MKTWMLLVLGLASSFAQAEDLYCQNMAKLACLPTTRNDGTGENLSLDDANNHIEQAQQSLKPKIKKKVADFLNSEDGAYVRNLVMAKYDISKDECATMGREACEAAVQDGLYEITRVSLLGREADKFRDGNAKLKEIGAILWVDSYRKMRNSLEEDRDRALMYKSNPEKVKKIFADTRNVLIERLKELPIKPETLEKVTAKLRDIRLNIRSCSDEGDGRYSIGAYYMFPMNHVVLCAETLAKTNSEFALVRTLAHELAHAFDPCKAGPDSGVFDYVINDPNRAVDDQYIVPGLVSCLRSPQSIGARNYLPDLVGVWSAPPPVPQQGAMGGYGNYPYYPAYPRIPQGPQGPQRPPGPQARSNVADSDSDSGFPFNLTPTEQNEFKKEWEKSGGRFSMLLCSKLDQIGESFGDWVAAEILPRYMRRYPTLTKEQRRAGYANATLGFCSDHEGEHPKDDLRINALLMQNPLIRAEMGCGPHPKYVYCDVTGATTAPAASPKGAPEAVK